MSPETSAVTIAAVLAAIGGTLMYFHKAPKFVCWMFLLAGFGLTGGLIGETTTTVGGKLGEILDNTTAKLLGVGVPMIIIAVATTWLVVEIGPKKKKGAGHGLKGHGGEGKKIKRATPWIALGYATLLAVVGGISIGTGQDVLVSIGTGMSDVATMFVGGMPDSATAHPGGTR